MVHWRREWQSTSVFLPWEPHEQYENLIISQYKIKNKFKKNWKVITNFTGGQNYAFTKENEDML